jgi:two-component system sensor histidine kinase KdpD
MADQRRNSDQCPSPEALLEAPRREENRVGKLKIFIPAGEKPTERLDIAG